jgi:hypothetical protein
MSTESILSALCPESYRPPQAMASMAILVGTTCEDRAMRTSSGKVQPIGSSILKDLGFFAHEYSPSIRTEHGPRRAVLQGEWTRWNGKQEITPDSNRKLVPIGRTRFHGIIQSASWESVCVTTMHSQVWKNAVAKQAVRLPSGWQYPIGNRPACRSDDCQTATQWNGQEYQEVDCLAKQCPFFQAKDCKPKTSLIFALNEPIDPNNPNAGMFPRVSAYLITGSLHNADNFAAFRKACVEEWDNLCEKFNVPKDALPWSWYGIPFVAETYMKTDEIEVDGRRMNTVSPRIRLILDGIIPDIFHRAMEARNHVRQLMAGPELPEIRLLQAGAEVADRTVLTPDAEEPDERPQRASSRSRFEAAVDADTTEAEPGRKLEPVETLEDGSTVIATATVEASREWLEAELAKLEAGSVERFNELLKSMGKLSGEDKRALAGAQAEARKRVFPATT